MLASRSGADTGRVSVLGPLAFLVAAGIAAPARYLLDIWVQERTRGQWPWGTLVVNTLGCFLAGLVAGLGLHHGLGEPAATVLSAGGLGAFTTFSTVALESVRLIEEGEVLGAAANLGGSLAAGLLAALSALGLMAAL